VRTRRGVSHRSARGKESEADRRLVDASIVRGSSALPWPSCLGSSRF
jgi:hypothetical protein